MGYRIIRRYNDPRKRKEFSATPSEPGYVATSGLPSMITIYTDEAVRMAAWLLVYVDPHCEKLAEVLEAIRTSTEWKYSKEAWEALGSQRRRRTSPQIDPEEGRPPPVPNEFSIATGGPGRVYVMGFQSLCGNVISADEAIQAAAWLVFGVDPRHEKRAEILAAVHKQIEKISLRKSVQSGRRRLGI
jgi:hypothetical protein